MRGKEERGRVVEEDNNAAFIRGLEGSGSVQWR